MISGTTRLFAIIGDPIAHVRVPRVLNAVFARESLDATCVPMLVSAAGLADAVAGLRVQQNLQGFVVTSPHKKTILDLCDEVTGEAALVHAANAVRREPDGRLVGDLFDGRGFVDGLLGNGVTVTGRHVYVHGAGGAAYAVSFALARAGVASIAVRNRSPEAAELLAQRLRVAYPKLKTAATSALPRDVDLAVNATPVGLAPGDPPSFDPTGLQPGALVAEVLMKPEVTPLLVAAAAAGYRTHPGKHMLDFQVEPLIDFFKARERVPRLQP